MQNALPRSTPFGSRPGPFRITSSSVISMDRGSPSPQSTRLNPDRHCSGESTSWPVAPTSINPPVWVSLKVISNSPGMSVPETWSNTYRSVSSSARCEPTSIVNGFAVMSPSG